ncbi:uncharacterized protein GGS22DRAFT_197855 [Annulohypoxylon maeteangense]|uniref:uncharacterized protein n=1 Tax=Annulohypoxylon maeteangense TaxID=1927788 RepID=UPI0020074257|nr:uncharacterized protein GGS22DRAFT_197855 [Annulohypoxylon maeteangense]KAI0887928.1 hypothetical protein GGS22DRAFT_197855 [Annulohypoxylon maeteangense]
MASFLFESMSRLHALVSDTQPRPGLHPIPGSRPLTFSAAILPPLIYYIALLLLAPPPPPAIDSIYVKTIRNILALTAGFLFFCLPLAYHVPQSIGLTYQLGLVGLYGGCRVIDAFFISPYFFKHIPRRVKYVHKPRPEPPVSEDIAATKKWSDGGVEELRPQKGSTAVNTTPESGHTQPNRRRRSSLSTEIARRMSDSIPDAARTSYLAVQHTLSGPSPLPVLETATTESGWPQTLRDRASWALELELSMRGVGFTWTTADVRHTRKTWLPTVRNRVHSVFFHALPVLLVSWVCIRTVYVRYLASPITLSSSSTTPGNDDDDDELHLFDAALSMPLQLLLTASLGAFLMSAFSLGHSLFAIALSPLAPSPLAFFPPLYSTRVWDVTSVRGFWSYGWHRLFARLFLVYGVWPGEWVERKLCGKGDGEPADVGKVVGGFLVSAVVHAFSVRGVLGGEWREAVGEAWFFGLNGGAVVFEGVVRGVVRRRRRERGVEGRVWYDGWIGRGWWIMVLLGLGRNFARGWVKAGLVREIAFQ